MCVCVCVVCALSKNVALLANGTMARINKLSKHISWKTDEFTEFNISSSWLDFKKYASSCTHGRSSQCQCLGISYPETVKRE